MRMYSEEYLRDLETSAHLNRKQEQEIMICPVCGRKIDKWIWRTTCCGVEIVWTELKEGGKKMSKEEALKRLRDFMLSYGFHDELLEAYGMALDALEDQPEWISVNDRLPANANVAEKEYLVQFANDGSSGITILNYYDGWNCFVDKDGNYHNENEITNVLFWMELPKPKEVDEE